MSVPDYWRNETGGLLRPVVEKYLRGVTLSDPEAVTLRRYCQQWVMARRFRGASAERLRQTVGLVRSDGDLRVWLAEARQAGIDPL